MSLKALQLFLDLFGDGVFQLVELHAHLLAKLGGDVLEIGEQGGDDALLAQICNSELFQGFFALSLKVFDFVQYLFNFLFHNELLAATFLVIAFFCTFFDSDFGDGHRLYRDIHVTGLDGSDLIDDIEAFDDFSKHGVVAVEMRSATHGLIGLALRGIEDLA